MSETYALKIRRARPEDAADVARVYVESWQDAYPGLLPLALLSAISLPGQTNRWRKLLARQTILVAATATGKAVGFAHFGAGRDRQLGFEGEIYALYVDPAAYGAGVGRALLWSAFDALATQGLTSCMLWIPTLAASRYFCEAMGAKQVAERMTFLMGDPVAEVAYGWRSLVPAERSQATQ